MNSFNYQNFLIISKSEDLNLKLRVQHQSKLLELKVKKLELKVKKLELKIKNLEVYLLIIKNSDNCCMTTNKIFSLKFEYVEYQICNF